MELISSLLKLTLLALTAITCLLIATFFALLPFIGIGALIYLVFILFFN